MTVNEVFFGLPYCVTVNEVFVGVFWLALLCDSE